MYELFEHTADLGLRVSAPTLDDLLVEAARGFLTILVANPDAVRAVQPKTISLPIGEPQFLLFDWLHELLYIFESERLLLSEFDIDQRIDETCGQLKFFATCRGETMDDSRHHMDHEVKAITYHGLRVDQFAAGWHAEVIVDI